MKSSECIFSEKCYPKFKLYWQKVKTGVNLMKKGIFLWFVPFTPLVFINIKIFTCLDSNYLLKETFLVSEWLQSSHSVSGNTLDFLILLIEFYCVSFQGHYQSLEWRCMRTPWTFADRSNFPEKCKYRENLNWWTVLRL